MSIMGHSYLNEIVVEQRTTSPAEILERLNEKIEETFGQKDNGRKNGTDGMDAGLCLVDKHAEQIVFAGARRPLTIIHQGGSEQVHGTRRGIGEHYLTSDTPFQNNAVELVSGAMYYICSDGLQDQFGGPNQKKLMRKKVIGWLKEMEQMPANLREEWLDTRFNEWKGANAQIDDICVLGFSV
jgi:serine phosphatase RsbU (regulator of sigma subunit)